MQITSVNNISNSQTFTGKKNVNVEKSPKQKNKRNSLPRVISTLAVAGAIVAGVVYFTRKTEMPTQLDIDEFKKLGKFDKGNAFIKGKAYTGSIDVPSKDGTKTVLKYIDGVLESSTKLKKLNYEKAAQEVMEELESDYVPVSKIVYSYEDGIRTARKYMQTFNSSDRMNLSSETVIKPDEIKYNIKSFLGDKTRMATKKSDGSWQATLQETVSPRDGVWQNVTKNTKTGEVLDVQDLNYRNPQYPYTEKKDNT